MSLVTNIILTTQAGAVEEGSLEELNLLLKMSNIELGCGFKLNDNCAGTKHLECEIFLGAFNYLEENDFVEIVKKVNWASPELVQIFIQRDNEDRFTELKIWQGRRNHDSM